MLHLFSKNKGSFLICYTYFLKTGGAFPFATLVFSKQGELSHLLHLFSQNKGSFFICHTYFLKTGGAFPFATLVFSKQGELFLLLHLFSLKIGGQSPPPTSFANDRHLSPDSNTNLHFPRFISVTILPVIWFF